MTDIFSRKKRSEIMSKIRSRGTKPEITARNLMRKGGITGFTMHGKVFGRPDFVFRKEKVAVFIDGGFWHGRNFSKIKRKLDPFWREKISRNIRRDSEVKRELKKEGWKVVRFWDDEIKKNPRQFIKRLSGSLKK